MKKNWFVFCSLGLNVVLLLGIGYLNGEIKSLRSALHNEIQALEEVIDNEVSGEIAQIRSEMEEARRLHKSYDLHPTGMDSVSRALLVDFSLELKEWQADTAVTLLLERGNGTATQEIPLSRVRNGTFSAPVALSVENSSEIRLSAAISTGGVTHREELGGWGDISMLLPLQMTSWGGGVPQFQSGKLVLPDQSAGVEDMNHLPVKALEPEFYVYLNGQRIRTLPGVEDVDYGVYQYRCEPVTLEETVNSGDQISVSFACRDAYGLHYEFPLYDWEASEADGSEGSPYTAEGYTVSGGNSPILTWE